ncbi:trimethylguanosine synthase [Chloropicon primus]|uniref:Trimethylguanosine synthase n=2 Tax=Chloropicon primus TaxID=1764295 RepID=A0A5B8MMD9_9CHLO|nr:trimethylguanosine synthase [Chloropicon primus]UPR00828.1 trimethylguanosine synthase [Chloropicon primus]|eukprot:QDZ21617.1 trimethylguanosine synthase [Chloropicon primus]
MASSNDEFVVLESNFSILCANVTLGKRGLKAKVKKRRPPVDDVAEQEVNITEEEVETEEERLVREEMERLQLPLAFGSSKTNQCYKIAPECLESEESATSCSLSEEGSLSVLPASCTTEQGGDDDGGGKGGGVVKLWFLCLDADNERHYYFCHETNESQWTLPDKGYICPLGKVEPDHALTPEHTSNMEASEREALNDRLIPVAKGPLRYWGKRYDLFSMFDHGIEMDTSAWYSVTPEKLAKHQASEIVKMVLKNSQGRSDLRTDLTVLDGFCGVGGNSIQFALNWRFAQVYSCEITETTLHKGRANAKLYGVSSKINFMACDYFKHLQSIKASGRSCIDAIFLSPPWGGLSPPQNKGDVVKHFPGLPVGTGALVREALEVAPVVAIYIPKESKAAAIRDVMREANKMDSYHVDSYHVETNYLKTNKMKGGNRVPFAKTVYITRKTNEPFSV